ncbi:MAG: glycosyltransferase [Candidatus Brocadiia bacterium]|nr:MAG: glycosyltransferase [Candidatus Brocadiia bacterium]
MDQTVNADVFPRITIVMPSFNQTQYLEEAIRSILDQNYPNLEFMILDGGSTDGSQEIIERYGDSLTYWQSQPDKGQTDALIQGFCRATGDLLGWVNSDDVLLPNCLQTIAEVFISQPECGLFGGNYVLIDSNGKIIRCKRHPANANFFAKYGQSIVNQPGSFFKPEDYEAVGRLNRGLHYVMDTDLYVRMMLNGTRFAHTGVYLAGFRKHAAAKTVAQIGRAREESRIAKRIYWPVQITRARTRIIGRGIYRAYQILNCNYFRMTLETLFARGRHWQDWSGTDSGERRG